MHLNDPTKPNKSSWVIWGLLALPVIWFAVVLAQSWEPGAKLAGLLDGLLAGLDNPLALHWTDRTLGFVVIALLLYAAAVGYYFTTIARTRAGEEQGSAQWGRPKQVNAKYANTQNPFDNIILTQNVRVGFDTRKHRRNLNILCCGGSGAGKSRSFCIPSLQNAATDADNPNACSFVVCDPKGELLRNTGMMLVEKGYDIRVINLVNLEQSDSFNPFNYIRDDAGALKMINNLIKNTTPKTARSDDPFWEKAETALLSAIVLYLIHEAPEYEQNFGMVMFMLENSAASEENEEYRSPVDLIFEGLEEEQPDHIAVKEYKVFKQAAGKTAKSILVSAAVRLHFFNLPAIQRITNTDSLDLGSLGERKRAVFCIVPDNGDTSLSFLVGLLYSSAFQELYYRADYHHGGRLPVHVRFLMDEFANVPLPEDFERILSTVRSREISINIIVQNIAQLKALFKDSWENITGNCDFFYYMGGNEQSTHSYCSKLIGRQSLNVKSFGLQRGRSGSSSENTQVQGRELMMEDEVRMLDNDYGLLFIRGERPLIDRKYDLKTHPHYSMMAEGGGQPYIIAQTMYRQDDLSFPFTGLDDIEIIE